MDREAHWEHEGRSQGRRPEDLPQECRRLPDYAGNPGYGQQLSVGKLPRWQVNHPYHKIGVVASTFDG
ncbi:hypothetical protein B296_00004144 [Ensete ventricosum]|uniref:Uncharacterized protein n=1 Tax=Ensete ventricosum TaxID=4639 RepID=A0A427ART6_ENSVE|nr:hypothetical protein B296_00004144 [Ensete ventricosum]